MLTALTATEKTLSAALASEDARALASRVAAHAFDGSHAWLTVAACAILGALIAGCVAAGLGARIRGSR